MNLREYINQHIDKFCKSYFNPQSQALYCLQDKIVRQYKRRYDQVNSSWSKINSNSDVEGCLNGIKYRNQQYKSILEQDKPLCTTDYFDVYLSMYSLIYALQKVASCYDSDNCDFHYTEKDIDQIFSELAEYAEEFQEIQMRNACRD